MSKAMFNKIYKTPPVEVAAVDLYVDYSYQRKLDESRAQEIALGWDESKARPLVISSRYVDGKRAVLDGNHTLNGAVLTGADIVEAWVLQCDSVESEAEAFLALNPAERKEVGVRARTKARHAAGEANMTAISNIAESFGFYIEGSPGERRPRASAIPAGTAEVLVENGTFSKVLSTIKSMTETLVGKSLPRTFFLALSDFVSESSEDDISLLISGARRNGFSRDKIEEKVARAKVGIGSDQSRAVIKRYLANLVEVG